LQFRSRGIVPGVCYSTQRARPLAHLFRLVVGGFSEFFEALLELYNALPQRPRYRGQSAAKHEQHNKQQYEQLPNTDACQLGFASTAKKLGLTAQKPGVL
jgi:hypothetical protein